jgi:hypothetical protein
MERKELDSDTFIYVISRGSRSQEFLINDFKPSCHNATRCGKEEHHLMSRESICLRKRGLSPWDGFLRTFLVSLILLLSLSKPTVAGEPLALCEEFQKLLSTRGGLLAYELEAFPDRDGNKRVPNIDVDGDGLIDEMLWSCPGSGSLVPADPCAMSIMLSTGKNFEFKESRFYLIQYRSKIYAVAIEMKLDGTVDKRKLYRVDGTGVNLICSKL